MAMRRKPWLLIGLAGLLLTPVSWGQSSGGGSGDSRSRFGSRFPSRFGSSGSSNGSTTPPSSNGSSSSNAPGTAPGGGDPNQMFDQFSKGSPVVRREDLPPPLQFVFDRSAAQMGITNGQMTREQFTGMMQAMMAMRQSMQSPEGQSRFGEDFFRRQDRNGDGLLNFDEMSDALKDERDKWDMNRDGFIDLNEYLPYIQGRMQQRQQERGDSGGSFGGFGPPPQIDPPPPPREEEQRPVVYRAGKLPKELPSWFAQYDTDADAQVGLYEWKNSGKSLDEFRGFDVNDDGFVTVAEVLRVNKQKSNGSVASTGGSSSNGSRSGLGNIMGMFGRGSSSSGSSSSGGSSGFGRR
jgi:Ca2+-binding EF-hand superfamily protein